ncbi:MULTISPECIES: dihydropteroate synthase [unclassified Rothia (in: high G+C Gram-positive bacteria)]|uniref:dihydropteroate synthase n=1 Tax=unclassified Rothia (in: high G+C Gram-positive bacteria) TaxID=2689056 RepID=UPI00195755CC|nr:MULTISPECIES: dihydropteroate synthase [unclassified Rothia (in: high G+C Gram-positive bacteria)]MBM7051614.1 dihydropteroate synthase [Rothia sp. ZJ1223]QRZ61752.1 dihydropteroate synthase [Rothia sp. ZJ932]
MSTLSSLHQLSLPTDRTLVMGILNVTPDSFSDGGLHLAVEDAVTHAKTMMAQGADIIDVGGESTRPGATSVGLEDEQARVLPVIEALAKTDAVISIDTKNWQTARAAIEAGAHIINDVSGMEITDGMIATVADLQVPYILMHSRGNSQTMDSLAAYTDTVAEVKDELIQLRERLYAAGVKPENLILDPGLGFAKGGQQDWQLVAATAELAQLGNPLLVAGSRKRFIGTALAEAAQARPGVRAEDQQKDARTRDGATAAITALVAAAGAWAVRVHDVPSSVDAVTVAQYFSRNSS